MEQGEARAVARDLNARGGATIYVAGTDPVGSWGGHESGWAVYVWPSLARADAALVAAVMAR